MSAVPVRESVHQLVDLVPEDELPTVESMLRGLVQEHNPVLWTLEHAPEDNEPVSPEESDQVHRAMEQVARGEVIPDTEFWRKHECTADG